MDGSMINTLFGNLLCRDNKIYSIIKSYKLYIYAKNHAKRLNCKWTKDNNKYLVITEL